jgi:hypothetical protein
VDLAIHFQLTNAAGDELGVLAPEVQNKDLFVVDVNARHEKTFWIQNPKTKVQELT